MKRLENVNGDEFTIDFTDFDNGMYFILLKVEGETKAFKVLKY